MPRYWGEHSGDEYPHQGITQAIIEAAIRVQKALGPGLLEDADKTCLTHALRGSGHKALREVRLDWATSRNLVRQRQLTLCI